VTFPGAGAHIIRNEAGEPLGWDYPTSDPADYYCPDCGYSHSGPCEWDNDDAEVEGADDLETVEAGADLETARAAFARNLRRVGIPEQYLDRIVGVVGDALGVEL
jgi:hypothetical protein